MASKRMKMIQTRPEPPDLDSTLSDLEKAQTNDVVFSFFQSVDLSNDDDLAKGSAASHLSTSRDALATEVPSTVSTKPKSSELNHCYTQTVQFIRMNDYLKDSQERLADQATELQRLGQAIKEQVESLRTQLS